MKSVFVTGGAGFIGSHLCDAYLQAGWNVLALDDLSTGSLENLRAANASPNFRFVQGDIRDDATLAKSMQGADLVVHLAARIGLKLIIESPLKTLEVNGKGTEAVLRHAADRGIRTIVTSTSEVYGLTQKFPSAEADAISIGAPNIARWSYACAKAYDESLAFAYHREFDLPVTVLRLFNTVGPRQSAHYGMVLPRFVRQALSGAPLTVYGDGTQTRCFAHVDDIVAAIAALSQDEAAVGQVLNLGNPQEIRIIDLAKKVIAAAASSSEITFVPFEQAYELNFEEIMRRVPDISKARALIGFTPQAGVDDVIHDLLISQRSQTHAVAVK